MQTEAHKVTPPLEVPNILSDFRKIRREYPESSKNQLWNYFKQINNCPFLSPKEKKLIKLSTFIACFGHKGQERKKKNSKGETLPYIIHNLEMSKRAFKDGVDDPLLHILIWLHDVPEDAPNNYQGTTQKKWIDKIVTIYSQFGINEHLKKRMINQGNKPAQVLEEMLFGITNKKNEDLSEKEKKRLKKTPMHKLIIGFMGKGGVLGPNNEKKPIGKKLKEKVLNVIATLENLFDCALISPDHLRLLQVKALDVWQNYKDPKLIREEKILRGVIAINIAYLSGWYQLYSELIEKLSRIINLSSLQKPFIDENEVDLSSLLGEYRILVQRIEYLMENQNPGKDSNFDSLRKELKISLGNTAQGPYPVNPTDSETKIRVGELFLQHESVRFTYPKPVIIFFKKDGKEQFLRLGEKKPRIRLGSASAMIEEITSLSTFVYLLNELSGKTVNTLYKVVAYGNSLNQTFFVLVRSAPLLIDFFKSDKKKDNERIKEVPEIKIFNTHLREDTTLWKNHLSSLIAFMYSPNALIQNGQRVLPAIIHNWLLFLSKRQLEQILGDKGRQNPAGVIDKKIARGLLEESEQKGGRYVFSRRLTTLPPN